MTNEDLDELLIKYNEKNSYLTRMSEEKARLQRSKMQHLSDEHLGRILQENEKLNCELETEKRT
ncbi:hypothetical protein RJ641_020192 [Dillenia turbinata]|uniref:Uncharacterized protein n=1 Tax=Dillenia turbinata TaxID=194707 RepID=A0AAN8YWN5_9MAGN